MYYEKCSSTGEDARKQGATVVDLRSDTVTKPTSEMREAMRNAEVGDDVYGEDPTVKRLERRAADMVGTEGALFVSSGTMGNLIAVMVHCDARGCEAYCGEESHCLLHEQTGAAQLAGVNLRPLKNNTDGTFSLVELEGKLRRDRDHEPISRLVMVEDTINGKIVPRGWLQALVAFCKRNGLKLHMDGARIWDASVGSSVPVTDIVRGFDSVTFCLSKGLGAPAGSMLCGTADFIVKARRARKLLGGGMRQVGVLAAAGLVALDHVSDLSRDHKKAASLASTIAGLNSKMFLVDRATVQTNMVFVEIRADVQRPADLFARRLREGEGAVVKALPFTDKCVRFVFHRDIDEKAVELAVEKIVDVIGKLEKELPSGN